MKKKLLIPLVIGTAVVLTACGGTGSTESVNHGNLNGTQINSLASRLCDPGEDTANPNLWYGSTVGVLTFERVLSNGKVITGVDAPQYDGANFYCEKEAEFPEATKTPTAISQADLDFLTQTNTYTGIKATFQGKTDTYSVNASGTLDNSSNLNRINLTIAPESDIGIQTYNLSTIVGQILDYEIDRIAKFPGTQQVSTSFYANDVELGIQNEINKARRSNGSTDFTLDGVNLAISNIPGSIDLAITATADITYMIGGVPVTETITYDLNGGVQDSVPTPTSFYVPRQKTDPSVALAQMRSKATQRDQKFARQNQSKMYARQAKHA